MAHRDGQSWKKVWRKEGPFLKGAGKEVPKGTSFFWGGLERKFLSKEDQHRSVDTQNRRFKVEPQNRRFTTEPQECLLAQMTMSDKTTVVPSLSILNLVHRSGVSGGAVGLERSRV